jgi:hypothetical protein
MAVLSPELEAFLPRFIQIESGGNPNARSGSYTGFLQMGPDEIAKYGGNGLEQGRQLLADRAAELTRVLGRPPSPTELYLAHQQGMGGAQAHMANPDAPAWQNMHSTGEGRRKGEAWAKKAIWGNVPDDVKAQYPGGVDSLTSQQFMDLWRAKVERVKPTQTATAAALPPTGLPIPPQVGPPLNLAPPTQQPAQMAGFSSPAPQQAFGGGGGSMPQMEQFNSIPAGMPPIFPPPRKRIDLSRLKAAFPAPWANQFKV